MPGQNIPLRISHLAYGREKRGNRVVYLLDPAGEDGPKGVAEAVVLHRWRRRRMEGYVFSGARLGPNLWRTLALVLPGKPAEWAGLSPERIAACVTTSRESGSMFPRSLPNAKVLHALFTVCGARRLGHLIARHTWESRGEQYGTPDLFLFAMESQTGRISMARFVEVKKPEEAVSADQKEEIAFLRSLGLQARVLRLIERDAAGTRQRPRK